MGLLEKAARPTDKPLTFLPDKCLRKITSKGSYSYCSYYGHSWVSLIIKNHNDYIIFFLSSFRVIILISFLLGYP